MKSVAIAFVLALCACGGGGGDGTCVFMGTPHEVGETFPAGDGCNSCTCTAGGPLCTKIACSDAGVDANPQSCAPFGGCPLGPACGTVCCGQGERCANGTCVCGTSAPCRTGDTCERGGPIDDSMCGSVCCGASGPCPA